MKIDKQTTRYKCQDYELIRNFCLRLGKVALGEKTVSWAINNGYSTIASDYGIVPKKLERYLTASSMTSKFWSQTQLNATKKIIAYLNKDGIEPTLLKGISISSDLYSQSYYRMMRDIDILFNESDVEKVEMALPVLGYEQRSTYSKEFYRGLHHTMPWQHCKDEIWIEVHKKLFPRTSKCYSSPSFQTDTFKKEIRPGDFFGLNVFRFSYEFQIIYIASHWAERFKKVGGVTGLIDVSLIINEHNDEIDWDKIIFLANTPNVVNFVYLMLSCISSSGFLKPNINITNHLKKMDHTLGVRSHRILITFVSRYIFNGMAYGRILTVNNVALIWKHLLGERSSWVKIFIMPVIVLFPKGQTNRFSLKFQYSRIKNFFKSSK